MSTYKVTVSRRSIERGAFEIEAATEEEAIEIAEQMLEDGEEANWNCFDGDHFVDYCEAYEDTYEPVGRLHDQSHGQATA